MLNLTEIIEHELLSIDKPGPTFIFPEFQDERVIIATSQLSKFFNIILPVSRTALYNLICEKSIRLEQSIDEFLASVHCLDLSSENEKKILFSEKLAEISKGKKWEMTPDRALKFMNDPLYFSIMAVRFGFAEAILGGLQLASKDYFAPCLRLLKKEGTVFELGLFVLPDEHPAGVFNQNIVVFSDVAVNPVPDAAALTNIAIGTCQIIRDIIPENVLPEVNGAILSYSTKGSGSGPAVDVIRAAGKQIPEKLAQLKQSNSRYKSIRIEWELQASVAISEKAAQKKLTNPLEHLAAGRANVLILPNLDFGNSLYHLYATTWPTSVRLLQIGGIFSQALDFSRSSTADDVVLGAKALGLQHLKRSDFNGTPQKF